MCPIQEYLSSTWTFIPHLLLKTNLPKFYYELLPTWLFKQFLSHHVLLVGRESILIFMYLDWMFIDWMYFLKETPKLWNTGLVSSGVSFNSCRGVSLALVGHPSSDGVTIKIPYRVDVLHWPVSHPIFSCWVG